MSDFLIGDEGGYSLSRLQMMIWAITIISYQLSVLLTLLLLEDVTGGRSFLFYYELDFSESIVWLLGLSLVSYISVKGITVEKVNKDSILNQSKDLREPEPIDIVSSVNGLDFSKCQMVIWTLVAIFVFNTKVYEFDKAIYRIMYANTAGANDPNYEILRKIELRQVFNNHYEEYGENEREGKYDPNKPFVPYLPWTFIILMGLSQGAYIGKKLVPVSKLDQIRKNEEIRLGFLMEQLIAKKEQFSQLLQLTSKNALTPNDMINIENLEIEIEVLETQIAEMNLKIEEIKGVNI